MSTNKKILIVDDNAFVRNVLEGFLKPVGYITHQCADGEEALDELRKQEFDVVITDIVMPKKDGIQLLNDMRAEDILTPVIAVSGDAGGKNAEEKVNAGCHYAANVLKKPVKKDDLLKLIEEVLDHS